jgi:hypothetical protein
VPLDHAFGDAHCANGRVLVGWDPMTPVRG